MSLETGLARSTSPLRRGRRGFALVEKSIVVLGAVFFLLGAKYLVLLVAGTKQTAFVTSAVERYALPNGKVYSVQYEFFPPGQKIYRGDGAVDSSVAPSGSLPVRYLAFLPFINHPGSDSLLAFFSGVLIVLGFFFFSVASKSQRRVIR